MGLAKCLQKSFNFQPFSNLTCPMCDIGNIAKDIWQVKKLDFNGVSQDKLNTKSSSIGDRLSSWGQAALKFLGISRIFWMSGVGCPEAYGHTQKLFFGVRRQSALKFCNVGGFFPTFIQCRPIFNISVDVLSGSSKFEELHQKIVLRWSF